MYPLYLFVMIALSISVSALDFRPIRVVHYEDAIGLQRRALDDFTDLSLRNQSQLMYHGVSSTGQHHIANLTIYTPGHLPMATMEGFEGLTSAVDCNADDGIVSLTFQSENAYKFALQEWAYINEKDDDHFLLIPSPYSCGADDDRQPYMISNVIEDAVNLTTYLKAQPALWSNVTGDYDLKFGHLEAPQTSERFKRDGNNLVDRNSFWHCWDGDCDVQKKYHFSVDIGQKGERKTIIEAGGKVTVGDYSIDRFKLDCVDCYFSGKFQLAGHLVAKDYKAKVLTLTVTPQDVSAALQVEFTLAMSKKEKRFENLKVHLLQPVAIPDAGVKIGSWLDFGATVQDELICSATYKGSVTAAFGFDFGIPNDAVTFLDALDHGKSSASGWFKEDTFQPKFNVENMTGSLFLEVYNRPKLSFGIDARYFEKLDIGMQIKMPVISETLTAGYDEKGFCDHDEGAITTGVKAETDIGVSVDMVAEAAFAAKDARMVASAAENDLAERNGESDLEQRDDEPEDEPKDDPKKAEPSKKGSKKLAYTKNLYTSSVPLATGCHPVDLPAMVGALQTDAPLEPPDNSDDS